MIIYQDIYLNRFMNLTDSEVFLTSIGNTTLYSGVQVRLQEDITDITMVKCHP